jgi:ATP-dependent exoDNAse (exonuclease V) beta subunit
MNDPADWQEREMGRDPGRSCIVQAPAGSGKTELLTQRMLGLLAQVEHPEEVVAITFTRKAAAEMSRRLLERLQEADQGIDTESLEPHEKLSLELAHGVLKNDRERGWNLLEQPSRLRIRTIDSLCGELARQLPLLSGLGGGQKIIENADDLYRRAAVQTMAAMEDNSDPLQADVIRILDRYDNQYDRLAELLTSMLGHREQWLEFLLESRTETGFDRHALEDSLRYLVEAELQKARADIPDTLLSELPRFFNYALSNSPQDGPEVRALFEACGGFDCNYLDLPVTSGALSHWITVIGRLLTADGKKWRAGADAKTGFPAPSNAPRGEKMLRKEWKEGFKALLDRHRGNDRLREQLNSIRKLPQPDYDDEAWESLESLMRILMRAGAEWEVVMAETGEADFGEIASRAIEALGLDEQPSNLALRLDYRIQHLLVDEFQDTSHTQIRLLQKLTAGWYEGDGHTLFLVGDPMQSIYRFRKAEVSLFIKTFEGRLFDHLRLEPLKLTVNFRSSRPIVDWVNRVFPEVMPAHSEPLDGAVSFSSSATRPGVEDHGEIGIRILPERDDEKEARQVIDIIARCDPEEKTAILVRSRKHAARILALLDRLKEEDNRFRYQAIDFNPLAETAHISDLVSLTLALVQPADRLAWLSVLRAPFAGLEMADLDELAGTGPGAVIPDAIEAAVTTTGGPGPDCGEDGRQRLARIGPIFQEAAALHGRVSSRTLVESTWVRLGGPACLQNDSEMDDAATYFELLDTLEAQGFPIDRDTLNLRLENLYASPDALASDKLQVMTIYAAKGLQFQTVILPGLNKGTRGDRQKLLHWFEIAEADRIVISPMHNAADREKLKHSGNLIQFISNVEKRRQILEDGRLLYVASTRAVHSLYLFADITPGANGEIKPRSATLLGELWPAMEREQVPLIRRAADQLPENRDPAVNGESTAAFPQVYRRLPADWQLPPAPECVQQTRAEPQEAQDYIEFRWAGEDARFTGNLVHRLLQQIAEQGLEAWEMGGGMQGRENWCRRQLMGEGVQGNKAEAIIASAARAVRNCLESGHGRWILAPHEDSHCEYALTAVIDGRTRNLVLDRSFVENGTRWIIDYKTSSHSGGDLEGFLDNEAERYREQLQRYRKAVAITETRPIRAALYFPLLDQFREI